MYYEFPDEQMAYAMNETSFTQYFFGPDLLSAPVVTPLGSNQMAQKNVWIPPGQWFLIHTGSLFTGPKTVSFSFDLSEIPVFARAGSVIPRIPISENVLGIARRPYGVLQFDFIPGENSGKTSVYEDDGVSNDYLTPAYFYTNVGFTRMGSSYSISLTHTAGNFVGKPASRIYRFHLLNYLPLSSTSNVNGIQLKYSSNGGAYTWRYDGPTFTTIIETGPISTDASSSVKANVDVAYSLRDFSPSVVQSFRGLFLKADLSKRNLDQTR